MIDGDQMPADWLLELRQIHNRALDYDWGSHLRALNRRLGLDGDDRLSTTDVGLPPAWFNGDVEAVEAGNWVLVVSLNPAKPPQGYYGVALTPATAWDFWRTHNREWWYWRFFRPLVQVASVALGEDKADVGERDFASERMVFIELCPYASGRFGLAPEMVAELAQSDLGFLIAAEVRRLLIQGGQPALVLVNGQSAVTDIELVERDRLTWRAVRYESAVASARRGRVKQLWHKQGHLTTPHGSVPIVGFPFLRKPQSHNSNAELRDLGKRIHTHLRSICP